MAFLIASGAYEGSAPEPPDGCPKRMQFGPCGGVRPDGGCEMRPSPCVFEDLIQWPGVQVVAPQVRAPLVLADFSCRPYDAADLSATAAVLAPHCDAVLVGEHQNRPDFPPTVLGGLLLEAGVTPWITLACRDRNRIVLEQELRGLQFIGVDTVLCVTGDGRGYDVRPDVTQVFDLDGTRLAALAASVGITAAVPETPTAPPRQLRPARLVQKQLAGAAIAVLNHVRTPSEVAAFMTAAQGAGLSIPVVAAVAVYTDALSAATLGGLPGLELDEIVVARVLGADDPVSAGIDAAVDEATELLAISGIAGVNLSGLASASGSRAAAEIKAEIGSRIRSAMSG